MKKFFLPQYYYLELIIYMKILFSLLCLAPMLGNSATFSCKSATAGGEQRSFNFTPSVGATMKLELGEVGPLPLTFTTDNISTWDQSDLIQFINQNDTLDWWWGYDDAPNTNYGTLGGYIQYRSCRFNGGRGSVDTDDVPTNSCHITFDVAKPVTLKLFRNFYSFNENINIPATFINEYAPATITVNSTGANQAYWYVSPVSGSTTNVTAGGMLSLIPANMTVTCTRAATPLTLTITSGGEVDFNSITVGTTAAVLRSVTWSSSGTGHANTWTMTFNGTGGSNYVSLGNARVYITQPDNPVPVTLGQPVNIVGTTGVFNLTLDPTGVTAAGAATANMLVTLTAN
ncbi:hypothetical protein [Citrobacter braakii]|uniref:hypothetical protein n=1 Tax=Citrobacter braakii TaxID=57706 RepID=UPI00308002AF